MYFFTFMLIVRHLFDLYEANELQEIMEMRLEKHGLNNVTK
jgi:hypothetical protein